jgi:uncharacterized membrane protein (UPF0136 family)
MGLNTVSKREIVVLTMIGSSIARSMSQRIAGTGDTGIIPTVLLATGARMFVSRKNIPIGLALIGTAFLLLEYNRRTTEKGSRRKSTGRRLKDT